MIPQVDYCLVRPSPFTFMARFSKVRTNHRLQQLHGSPATRAALHTKRFTRAADRKLRRDRESDGAVFGRHNAD